LKLPSAWQALRSEENHSAPVATNNRVTKRLEFQTNPKNHPNPRSHCVDLRSRLRFRKAVRTLRRLLRKFMTTKSGGSDVWIERYSGNCLTTKRVPPERWWVYLKVKRRLRHRHCSHASTSRGPHASRAPFNWLRSSTCIDSSASNSLPTYEKRH